VIRVGQKPYTLYAVYGRIVDEISAKDAVYALYLYGSGHPYTCTVLGIPTHARFWPPLHMHISSPS